MQALSAEFWVIVVAAVFVWVSLVSGIARLSRSLWRMETNLCRLKTIMEEAPWMEIEPEDVTELLMSDRVQPFLRRRGDR